MKSIFTFILLLTFSGVTSAQQAYQGRNTWSLNSVIDRIQIYHLAAETEGSEKGETIYKARGVTILSAINSVNNRALRKLKTEAAMLGADAVLITNNYQKGVQFLSPVQVTYTAVAYTSKPLTLDQVRREIVGKVHHHNVTARYNRNFFGHNLKLSDNSIFQVDPEKLYEQDGKIMIILDREYQIVSISPDHLVLGYYAVPGKVITNVILRSGKVK